MKKFIRCFGIQKGDQTTGLQQAKLDNPNQANFRSLIQLIFQRRRYLKISGNSMLPNLKEGEIVIYQPIKNKQHLIKRGLIVIASNPLIGEQLIIKRVYKIYSSGIDIRGDNQTCSIDSRQFGLIHPNQIIGIVDGVIH